MENDESTTKNVDQKDEAVVAGSGSEEEGGAIETGLFGDEMPPSEEELKGADVSSPEAKSPEKPPESEAKAPEKPPEAKPEAKPPEGYVPLAALQEERGKRQQLAQVVEDLKKTVETIREGKQQPDESSEEGTEEDTFKELSRDEYAKLAEDDIVAAQVYLFEKAEHEKKQAEKRQGDAKKDDIAAKVAEQVAQRHKEIEEAIPGIYDESNPVNKDMTAFAVENGMDVDYLAALTDPGTRITLPDGSTFILGRGAVGLSKMIHSTMTKSKNGTPDDKALREAIRKEVTKELLEKFQTSGANAFRSIGDSPGVGETPVGGGEITEDTFRNLTEAQQEALLRGA